MRILFDTNVILDIIEKRDEFAEASFRLFQMCEDGFVEGFVSTQSVADIFYILRKNYPATKRKELLRDVCAVLDVVDVVKLHVLSALSDDGFPDLEDGIISKCAEDNGINHIITRNKQDFAASRIPVATPREFLDKMRV
ncbi:MAG: PIN domain-containing protein [Kiritimatiellaeota bacterium]|nr:PIN domain-containing protein [Kiritimatiellota bacterium]